MLLCDDVLVSRRKNKHTLQGVIGAIGVRQFPAVLGVYVAYLRVSNVYGSQKITVRFEKTRTDQTVFEFEAQLPDQQDPLGVYTLAVDVPPFAVDEAGRYMLSALSDNLPLAQSPIIIQGPAGSEDPA